MNNCIRTALYINRAIQNLEMARDLNREVNEDPGGMDYLLDTIESLRLEKHIREEQGKRDIKCSKK